MNFTSINKQKLLSIIVGLILCVFGGRILYVSYELEYKTYSGKVSDIYCLVNMDNSTKNSTISLTISGYESASFAVKSCKDTLNTISVGDYYIAEVKLDKIHGLRTKNSVLLVQKNIEEGYIKSGLFLMFTGIFIMIRGLIYNDN